MSENACGLVLAIGGLIVSQLLVLWLVLSSGLSVKKGPSDDGA